MVWWVVDLNEWMEGWCGGWWILMSGWKDGMVGGGS